MNQTAYIFFTNKIHNIIINKYEQNINAFIKENQDCDSFISKYNLNIVIQHMNYNITNEEYQQIINSISEKYQKQNILIKNNTIEEKIANIVDTINIAFITGGVIGIILLNIYSKIAQYF